MVSLHLHRLSSPFMEGERNLEVWNVLGVPELSIPMKISDFTPVTNHNKERETGAECSKSEHS